MSERSVFVPVSLAGLRSLQADGILPGPVPAYGITRALLDWGEFGPEDVEDATFAAQTFAEVHALTDPTAGPDERRIVLALPADGFTADDVDGFGVGSVPQVRRTDVLAVFADETDTDVRAAREAVRGAGIEAAWADETVAALVDEHELGWHEPGEVAEW